MLETEHRKYDHYATPEEAFARLQLGPEMILGPIKNISKGGLLFEGIGKWAGKPDYHCMYEAMRGAIRATHSARWRFTPHLHHLLQNNTLNHQLWAFFFLLTAYCLLPTPYCLIGYQLWVMSTNLAFSASFIGLCIIIMRELKAVESRMHKIPYLW